MKIGELATATATPVETVRFYEREGLLPEPGRTAGNYRVYDQGHVARLAFIRRCRSLDMNLDEIRRLLHFRDAPADGCGEVDALLDEHIGHVSTRIEELRKLEIELRALRATCTDAQTALQCGILKGLSGSEASMTSREPRHVGPVHGRARVVRQPRAAR